VSVTLFSPARQFYFKKQKRAELLGAREQMRKDRERGKKSKRNPDRLIPTDLSTPKKTSDFLITPHQLIQLPSCAGRKSSGFSLVFGGDPFLPIRE
jgi:hypothetical protein